MDCCGRCSTTSVPTAGQVALEAELLPIPQLAEDLYQVLEEVVGPGPVILIGHSMGGMAIMRLAQVHPELFGTRILGVALFCTSAGEMADHSPIRGIPGRTFHRIAEPLMSGLNRIPELVAQGRRAGSDLGLWTPADWLRIRRRHAMWTLPPRCSRRFL